jgi:hypothetical protein
MTNKNNSKLTQKIVNKENELSQELWNNLIKDTLQLKVKGQKIGPKFIQDKYNLSKYDSDRVSFSLNNIDIIHNEVNKDLTEKKFKSILKELEDKNKLLIHELHLADKRIDFLLNIQDTGIDDKLIKLQVNKIKPKKREAVIFSMLSDVHIEETVEKEVVNGMNEYNPLIAKQRVENYFNRLLNKINEDRKNVNIDTLILGLLGDFITGYIHEELKESNSMSPTEATLYIKNILISGIKYLVDNGNFKEIIIPCTPGNHGRTTIKKRFSTGYKNSYEWMMYQDMKTIFDTLSSSNKKYNIVKFIVNKSELTYITVYDKVIRFGHGDHFKFSGGVGGITPALMKWLHNSNTQTRADMTFIGHWHSIGEPTYNCMVNGCVIGMSAYGIAVGGTNRPPQQIYTLLFSDGGFDEKYYINVS